MNQLGVLITLFCLGIILLAKPSVSALPRSATKPVYGYKIINIYPHDQNAFTQGLIYEDNIMYESTGRHGRSSLRKVDLLSGRVLQIVDIDKIFFAEGLTLFNDTLIQLTWKNNVGFFYNKSDLKKQKEIKYPRTITEGWGLTNDGSKLMLSDGSDKINFLNPSTFEVIGHIVVKDNGKTVKNLNELEYVNGEIYANIYMTNKIACISPHTGEVSGYIDLSGLRYQNGSGVLNGIAYDKTHKRLFVTGKLWSKIFEIELVKQ